MRHFKRPSVVAVIVILGVTTVFAMGLLNLPEEVCVAHSTWLFGTYSTLDITLSCVPNGFDVKNGTYIGWCLEANGRADIDDGSLVEPLDSTDPASFVFPCENYASIPWDQVNYLLNNKFGDPANPSTKFPGDVQLALWQVAGTNYKGWAMTPNAQAMVSDAISNGSGFVPRPGEIVAVALCADGLAEEFGLDRFQDTIIEVQRRHGEGCTPGYWKQEHHFDSWIATGYDPGDDFGDVFGVADSWNDTLESALWKKGGKEKALLRHATAALLNATSPEVNYYYTVDEVMSMVQSAYDGDESFNATKDLFEAANEMGCPLN